MNLDATELLDALNEPCVVLEQCDGEARVVMTNRAAARLVGVEHGEVDFPLSEVVEADPAELEAHVRTWFRSGASTPARLVVRTSEPVTENQHRVDATRLRWSAVPRVLVRFRPQEARTQFGALTDQVNRLADEVAHRSRVQMQLRQSETRLRTVLDSGQLGIYLVSADGELLLRNAGFESLVGFPPPEGFWAELHDVHRDVLENGPQEREELGLLGVDRERVLHGRWAPVDDPVAGSRVVCGVLNDVTVLHEAAAQHEALTRKAHEAQRLESLGLLAGGIAHDFNNLLVGVLGNAGIAMGEAVPGSLQQQALEDIDIAATRAADLCRQLLAYSGKGRFRLQTVNLNALLTEMLQLIRVTLSGGASLHTAFDTEPLPVHVDTSQIQQVVLNLVTNAVEALGEMPGVVTVRTSSCHCDREYLRQLVPATDLEPGDYICLEVTDTGSGMDAETLGRLFEPFFTTKLSGHGLGLAAVRGIASGHDGLIRVYSEVGRGTTFRLLLPRASGETQTLSQPLNASAAKEKRRGTILVVDDQPMVLKTCCRIVERAGYSTLRAENGVEALRAFDAFEGDIRAAILDMTMPVMGGVETLRQLRVRNPKLPVLLCSGFNDQDSTNLFAGRGLAGFIQKPYRSPDFLAALDKTIREFESED